MPHSLPRNKPGRLAKEIDGEGDDKKILGIRMRQAALESGMKQEEIALAVGVNKATISNWWNGTEMGVFDLRRYAKLMGKPLLWFFGEMEGVEDTVEDLKWRVERLEGLIEQLELQNAFDSTSLLEPHREAILNLKAAKTPVADIARRFGVSRQAIYNRLHEWKEKEFADGEI